LWAVFFLLIDRHMMNTAAVTAFQSPFLVLFGGGRAYSLVMGTAAARLTPQPIYEASFWIP
tara:strand:+ start:516 stop:698 length:183 start_codon:yes stop_codon:yes gene_type:complete